MSDRGERRRRTFTKTNTRRKEADQIEKRWREINPDHYNKIVTKTVKNKRIKHFRDRDDLDVRSWDRNPNNDLPMKDE